ncbi:DsbA family oxidoreductase [Agrococcus sp. BE272]|uniref:DsbA family oxidoreductase n=1 Tax=Agrococcus sp. BE272 TaxID=2817727 RepID=UPI0028618BF6|nr:DsbA family oxidoreductase [Agrococcus sp. BE272]MDR7234195.1 putative DsbA family dithiol-disulfide isomerase [Agrococcus sp. BE272]
MQIDIWSDVACPWCFIGKRRFEAALAAWEHRDEVEVTWHSFQLDPSLPERYDGTEVEYLSTRKGMSVEQVRQMIEHVGEQAAGEGLRYDFDRLVVANSLRAHQLLHLAKAHGRGDAVKEALLSAHFERGIDIGDVDALAALGAEAGLDEHEVREALADERFLPAVRADIAQARELGVNGVPFFVFDMRLGLSGAQPAQVFTQALEQAHALELEGATAER